MNALLTRWDTPFQLPPFEAIRDADFAPAFDQALAEARAEILRIAENPEAPTFANTVAALELAERLLDLVSGVFFNLAGADSTPAREALERDLAPKLSAHSSEITNNTALFRRIEALWAAREVLAGEELRVLELYRQKFVRAGAALAGAAAARLTAVKSRLAVLGTKFGQNLLADEREWSMELDEGDLAGLPEFVVASARAAGQEKGAGGPVVTLSRSLIVPFLQFSDRRLLRQKAYEAWVARGGEWRGDGQPGRCDGDLEAARGAGQVAGLCQFCRLPAGAGNGQCERNRNKKRA